MALKIIHRKKLLLLGLIVVAVVVISLSLVARSNHPSTNKSFTPEIENKLNGFLPIQTPDYRIDYSYDPGTKQYIYTATLYAIINRPDQYVAYVGQLKQFKQEALDYISSHGGDTSKLLIQYLPSQATDL